ncbi:MAG: glycosyltransferase family 4 protein [Actinobacteria bacterium]|nr:glycosyltransferase family 4 protein [Actinomycetota bacterium]
MKIGIDVSSAVNQTAGTGRYTTGLVKSLLKAEAYNEYVLYSFYGDASVLTSRLGVKSLELRAYNFNGRALRAYALALKMLGRTPDHLLEKADVFHVPDFAFPAPKGMPSVLTIHDLIFMRYPEHFTWINRTYMQKMAAFSTANADVVIADSENTRLDAAELLSIPDDKLIVVHPGVSTEFSPASEDRVEETLSRLGIRRPYILYTGTLEPRKNLPLLIEAYNLCCKRDRSLDYRLIVAGKKGWLYDEVFKRVNELKLADKVTFIGYVADQDLPALYSGAEVFVYPSVYEGFGFPVIEAMACGTPVICSNTSSLPEVAGDGALLFDPSDKEQLADLIMAPVNDNELRRNLVKKGFKNAERFSWAKTAAETLQVYERAVS